MKVSCITPILKFANTIVMADFHPVKVLSIIDKTLVSIIYDKLIEQVNKNKILFVC